MSLYFNCSECSSRACLKGGEYPDGCPSLVEKQTIDSAIDRTSSNEDDRNIMAASEMASHKENGAFNNRVEALIEFCHIMNYETIGVAFCVALAKEARVLCDMLSKEDFCVVPICCKVGGKMVSEMGIESSQKAVSCNPIAQAYVLNAHNTDVNVAVGLCLGHDILFSKHSSSPVTTLVVKDRVLKHNTVQTLQESTPICVG